jgi:hypothetical protein
MAAVNEKRCTKCGEVKPVKAFGLVKRRTGELRARSRCKFCLTANTRDWQARNAERARATTRRWRQTERGKVSNRASDKRYRESNRETRRAYRQRWAQTERGRASLSRARKKWEAAHPPESHSSVRVPGQHYLVSLDALNGVRTLHDCIPDRNAVDPLEALIQNEAIAEITKRLVNEKGLSREAAIAVVETHV